MVCKLLAGQLGIALWDRMTEHALGGETLKDACKLRPGSPALRRRVRAWQALTALSPFLTSGRIHSAFELTWRCMGVRAPSAPAWRLSFRACAHIAGEVCAVTPLTRPCHYTS